MSQPDPSESKQKGFQSQDTDNLKVAQAMIQIAYQAAVDPDKFEELIETWDIFFAQAARSEQFDVLAGHFEQAALIAADPKVDRSQDLPAILDLIAAPAVLVDHDGRFLLGNARGTDIVGRFDVGPFLAPFFDGDWQPTDPSKTAHFKFAPDTDQVILAACRSIAIPHETEAHYLIRFEASIWDADLSATLRDTYQLTEAEIGVAKLLRDGMSAVDIAKARERSLETIRTQIKSIMAKTDTQKQTGLVQFLSHLQYVASEEEEVHARVEPIISDPEHYVTRPFETANGTTLMSSWYGDPRGCPILYLTTSSRPYETPEWRQAVYDAGLYVLAPHRPGFGGSDSVGGWDQTTAFLGQTLPDVWSAQFRRAPITVVGHREGGILAAELSEVLAQSVAIERVVLISTGAPESETDRFGAASNVMTRSTGAYHTIPAALRLGYRAARRIFQAGPTGEQKIVSYFFKDSPVDTALIRDPSFWEITRNNIAYCFEDTDRIVEDVGRWTSPWDNGLRSSQTRIPWTFLHGSDHDFMKADRLKDYCASNLSSHADFVEGAAQMLLYVETGKVARLVAESKTPLTL